MGRALAILVVLGGLYAFLNVYTHGVEKAFGGAIVRLWNHDAATLHSPAEPTPSRSVSERMEYEERTPRQPIGQGVRERVNLAMDEGARRHSGED